MTWIKTTDQLPPEGKYVIAKHNRGTWIDLQDHENVNTVIVKLVKGISKEGREALKEFDPRGYNTHTFADEGGNNLTPYAFETFGPDSFFGQTITHWMEIPELTDK